MRCMDPTVKLILLLIFFRLASASTVENEKKFEHCERVVKDWALSSLHQGINKDKHTLQDLLFFLHVPKSGGRSFYHCFLRKLYPTSQECPLSYDKLRIDPSKPNCRMLATHDDYSMVEKLPKETTSVVTFVRNPVDRVLSLYEFSVEIAAKYLVHLDLASATKMSIRIGPKTNPIMNAPDIWPMKYLVSWMRGDLFTRRDARRQKGSSEAKSDSPYDMKDILMPLKEFLDDPIVHELVHNGATFQIAGLTNNSYLDESHEIRHCVQEHKSLGEHVLLVVKKRLDAMLYVGLTEKHKESVTMFANVVGAHVISQLREAKFSMDTLVENQSDNSNSWHYSELVSDVIQNNITFDEKATVQKGIEAKKGNMTVAELIEVYEGCIPTLLKFQSRRRFASLKMISPANFSKETRRSISEEVLEHIRTLNYLDVELFKYAQEIFAMRRVQLMENLDMKDASGSKFKRPRAFELWKVSSLIMLFILLLVSFLFVNAWRRVSKVKAV